MKGRTKLGVAVLFMSLFLSTSFVIFNYVGAWTVGGNNYDFRYRIDASGSNGTIINVNDTGFPNYWNDAVSDMYLYCENSGCATGNVTVGNSTSDELDWENGTSLTGNNPTSVWDSDVKGLWHMDVNTGVFVQDSTSNNNDGYFVSTPQWVEGIYNSALKFDDTSDDGVMIPDSASLNITGNMTFSTWIFIDDRDDWDTIFGKGEYASTSNYWFGYTDGTWLPVFTYYDTDFRNTIGTDCGALLEGQWYHYAIVIDKAASLVDFYINGTLCDSDVACDNSCNYGANDYNATIGGKYNIGSPFVQEWNGTIEDIILMGQTVSAADIADMYNNGIDSLTSLGAVETPVTAGLNVDLNYPADSSTNESNTVDFSGRFRDTQVTNCSLYTNESGWGLKHSNTSAVSNNTYFIIQEVFGSDTAFVWNVECCNSTHDCVMNPANRTITIATVPTAPTSITLNGTEANQNLTYYKDNDNITINCSGSTDPIGGDLTNYIEAYYNTTSESVGSYSTTYTGVNWTLPGENAGGTLHPDGKVYRYGGNSAPASTCYDNISVYNTSDATDLDYFLPTKITQISYGSVIHNWLDGCDYIYGGVHDCDTVNRSIIKHSASEQSAEYLDEMMPIILDDTCVAFYETWNSSIGCGGEGQDTFNITTSCFIHNFTAGTATNLSVVLPAERSKGGCYIVGEIYYFIGGRNIAVGGQTTIYKLNLSDLASGFSTEGYTLPDPLEITCRYDDYLNVGFCFGGIEVQDSNKYYKEIYEINHTAGTVSDIGDIPDAMDDFTVVCNGTIHSCYMLTMQPPGSADNAVVHQKMIYEFNYTLTDVSTGEWHPICSHLNGSVCNWTITDIQNQTDVDFRCRVADVGGSNTNSSYFTSGANVTIEETAPVPPTPFIVTISSPQNITYTTTTIDLNWITSSPSTEDAVLYSLNGAANVSLRNERLVVIEDVSQVNNVSEKVALDGNFIWISKRIGGGEEVISKKFINGSNSDVTIALDGCFAGSMCGVHVNGTNVFMGNDTGIFLYDKNGNFEGVFSTNLTGIGTSVMLGGNATAIWTGNTVGAVKQFDVNGNFAKFISNIEITGSQLENDMCMTDNFIYLSDSGLSRAIQYDLDFQNGVVVNSSFVGGIGCNSTDIFGGLFNPNFYRYNLTVVSENTTITAVQGLNNVTVWANTTNPSSNESTVFFFADSIVPVMAIAEPQNITYCDVDPQLNFTFVEINPDSCWYSINGASNVTLASCDTNGTVLSSNEGGNNVRLCMNDTAGNEGCDQVFYTKDAESPSITITNPANDTIESTNFDFTFNEDVDTAKYSINGGANVTNSDLTTSWSGNLGSLSVGPHNIVVWANDSCGHQNSTTRYFTIAIQYSPSDGSIHYNQFLWNFTNPEANTNANICWFIFNDAPPQNYTCGMWNTTINTNIGENNLTLCWTNISGDFCNETMFNISIRCSADELSDTICGGIGFSYILRCRQITANTYQFDYNNMTFCEFGCINGTCINRTFCLDNCKSGDTMCNGNYVISCKQKSDGCYDWSSDDKVFCNKGCDNGKCLDCQDKCNSGDATCDNPVIRYCQDDNGDGCLEFSDINTTTCEFGCFEDLNETTGINNVSCNYHSFDDIYAVRGAFEYGSFWFDYVFNTLNLKVWIILIMMVGFGGIAGIKANKENEGGWKVGLLIMSGIIFAASWFGWMPWVVTILFLIFVVGVWFSDKRNQ